MRGLGHRQVLLLGTHPSAASNNNPGNAQGEQVVLGKGLKGLEKVWIGFQVKKATLREPIRYLFLSRRTGAKLSFAMEDKLFLSMTVTEYFCITLSLRYVS